MERILLGFLDNGISMDRTVPHTFQNQTDVISDGKLIIEFRTRSSSFNI